MSALVILPLAFAPGIFWLWYFYRRGIYHPEPRRLIIRTFVLGMLITVPAGILEALLLLPTALIDLPDLTSATVVAFLVVGPVEEGLKFLVVRRSVYRFLDEPLDGIIYGAAAALGFASVENAFYMAQFGWWIILVRGPVSTLAHVVFAGLWAYPLGNRAVERTSWLGVALGLAAAMALHGAFNFFLFTESWPAAISVLLLVLGAIWLWRMIRRAQEASPLKGKLTTFVVLCPRCMSKAPPSDNFCTQCGASLSGARAALACGNCSASAKQGTQYCSTCGYRFVGDLSLLSSARAEPPPPATPPAL